MRFGQYDVLEELGRGGMGIVYKGFDPLIRREVALKTIRLSDIAHPDERRQLQERLEREAQSAGRLSHPNIVTIYQIGYTDLQPGETTAFITMEYVPGRNLASLLEKFRPSNPEPFVNLLKQAAVALDYAHRNGVIHRDVKPANLLVTPDGALKITDFGVAKITSQTMTVTGAVLGSPFYMSPEQIRAEPIDGRADQYSLAVVAYEIFGGRKPFQAETLSALVYKIAHEEPPRLTLEATPLAERLNPVLLRAMSKQPSQRYESCEALIGALEAALRAEAPPQALHTVVAPEPVVSSITPATFSGLDTTIDTTIGTTTGTETPRQPERQKRLAGWVAAGAAIGVLGAGYMAFRPSEKPEPAPPVETTIATPVSDTSRRDTPSEPAQSAPAPKRETAKAVETAAKPVVPPPSPAPKPQTPVTVKPEPVTQPAQNVSAPAEPPAPVAPPAAPVADVRTPPRVLNQVPAAYTEDARRAGIEGIVVLSVDIDERGIPRRARVVRSLDPGLDRKAIESLSEWRFAPGTLNGSPVASNASVEVAFRLIGGPSRKPLSLKKSGEN